jgi:hypothetical protein
VVLKVKNFILFVKRVIQENGKLFAIEVKFNFRFLGVPEGEGSPR